MNIGGLINLLMEKASDNAYWSLSNQVKIHIQLDQGYIEFDIPEKVELYWDDDELKFGLNGECLRYIEVKK